MSVDISIQTVTGNYIALEPGGYNCMVKKSLKQPSG